MSKVLLTGGTGYIGSHTAVSLLESGYEVVVVDNLVNSKIDSIKEVEKLMNRQVPTYIGDVQDEELMNRIFSEQKIDVVIHFAGLKAVGESVHKPIEYYQNNFDSTLVLIKTMLAHQVNNIVFSSSATVYDPANDPERVEGMPVGNCSCPYGWTKFMIEQIIRDCCHAYPQLNAVMLRYFNPVGAHPSGVIGENPLGIPNNLMPYIQQVAVGKLDHLNIFGNDYPTPDGTCIRDYIHVCDLADAHALACGYVLNHEGCCQEINIGSGHGVSVMELVTAFERANGMKLAYQFAPRREGDLPIFFANADKARELLGFETKRSVEDMCRDAYRYQQKQSGKE